MTLSRMQRFHRLIGLLLVGSLAIGGGLTPADDRERESTRRAWESEPSFLDSDSHSHPKKRCRDEDDEEDDGDDEGAAAHAGLVYAGPGTCLECHRSEALDLFSSTHYQWQGDTPDMLNAPGLPQGKGAGAINAYCGNILGNWEGCRSCHIGLGAAPEPLASDAQLANIDCLICHQEQYRRKSVNGRFVPDTEAMAIGLDEAVRTVHQPTRATCLQCHAKAGGGDAVKRGDLALASAHTTDEQYDVHLATTGGDLACQDCHRPEHHRFPGKGSDLRPTDLAVVLDCASGGCHGSAPHDGEEDGALDRHAQRVACQTCHIPVYAKDAADSAADEATEVHRSWTAGSHQSAPPYHPVTEKANRLIPVYRHWNRRSTNALLFDSLFPDPATGIYHTSLPDGAVEDPDSKLYPFKYKTSDYPLRTASSQLIALDTKVFFATAEAHAAAEAGLENMGFARTDAYQWVTTDTYQLLNHQVSDKDAALRCDACHMNTARLDLQGELGYAPRDRDPASCATGCHSSRKAAEWRFGDRGDFNEGHQEHREEGIACARCHGFTR